MIQYSNTLGGGGMAANGIKETYNIAAGQSIKKGDPVKLVNGYNGEGSPIKIPTGILQPGYHFSARKMMLDTSRWGTTNLKSCYIAYEKNGNIYATNYNSSYSDKEVLVASGAVLKCICYLSGSMIVFYSLLDSLTTLRAKYVERNWGNKSYILYASPENVIATSVTGDCTALGLGSNDFVVSYVTSAKYIRIARYTIRFTDSVVTSLFLESNTLQFANYTNGYTRIKPIAINGMLYLQDYGDDSFGHDAYYMLVVESYAN